jgi:hypothetical protein
LKCLIFCTAHEYCSGDQIKEMRWAEHIARIGKCRGVKRVLVGKPKEKRPLGKPRRGRDDNIWMDLRELGCVHTD